MYIKKKLHVDHL